MPRTLLGSLFAFAIFLSGFNARAASKCEQERQSCYQEVQDRLQRCLFEATSSGTGPSVANAPMARACHDLAAEETRHCNRSPCTESDPFFECQNIDPLTMSAEQQSRCNGQLPLMGSGGGSSPSPKPTPKPNPNPNPNPNPKPNPAPSPGTDGDGSDGSDAGGGGGSGAPGSSGSGQADVAQAQQAVAGASTCCNNPSACGGASGMGSMNQMPQMNTQSPGGMLAACRQMQALGAASANTNSNLASICYAKKSSCEGVTQQLISKNEAAGDPDGVLSQLYGMLNSCRSLQANMMAMTNQGTQGYTSGATADQCARLLQTQGQAYAPSNYALQNADPCASDPSSAACQRCEVNPNAPGCVRSSGDQSRLQKKESESEGGDFNTPDLNGVSSTDVPFETREPYKSLPAEVVPNNTGGAIPQSQGSSGASATAARPSAAAGGGYNTDVLQNPSQTGGGGGWSGYGGNGGGGEQASGAQSGSGSWGAWLGSRGRDPSGRLLGVDLKKFLPGQEKDPARWVGGLGGAHPDIGPKYGNLFFSINRRMKELCSMNRLYDCGK